MCDDDDDNPLRWGTNISQPHPLTFPTTFSLGLKPSVIGARPTETADWMTLMFPAGINGDMPE